MSVQNQAVKNVYVGNGSTTVFPYEFALNVTDGEYVGVYVTNDEGVPEATDNFTIDTTAQTVTYPKTGDPLESGKKIVIMREIPNEQELNLINQGPYFAEDIEKELDRQVMMIQQLQEQVDRSVKVDPASDTKPDEFIAELFEASADAVAAAEAAKTSENNAAASETAAGNSATAAALSETEAGNSASAAAGSATAAYNSQAAAAASETNASNSATAAGTSETNAANSASAAATSATAAGTSETNAANSASAAATSATAAATNKSNAQKWAEGTDEEVSALGGTHSAKEWAMLTGFLLRQNSTAYEVGDIAFSAVLPSSLVLQCTTAGTTASSEPSYSGAAPGGTVIDGTVVWTYRDIIADLSTYAKLASPTFTGTPKAPTASAGTNTTQIATTAFVQTATKAVGTYNHRDERTTSGTYTAPVTGWYKITVKGGGGGGRGGSYTSSMGYGGQGGGEGGTTIGYKYMTSGTSVSVTIGAGGSGGTKTSTGGDAGFGFDGGNSTVTVNGNTYTGGGGGGGSKYSGVGGTGTIIGASGGTPASYAGRTTGGNGGGNGGGSAIGTTAIDISILNGRSGGGGAGGVGATSVGNATNGGNGGNGYVWFEYYSAS